MNSQQLLFINLLIFAAVVLYFVLGRSKQRHRTILDLRKRPDALEDKGHSPSTQTSLAEVPATAEAKIKETEIVSAPELVSSPIKLEPVQAPAPVKPSATPSEAIPRAVRSQKGIYFAFNGHEWNAHEVLGGVYGDNLEQVTRQYQNLLKTADMSTFDFYEAAYNAILRAKR